MPHRSCPLNDGNRFAHERQKYGNKRSDNEPSHPSCKRRLQPIRNNKAALIIHECHQLDQVILPLENERERVDLPDDVGLHIVWQSDLLSNELMKYADYDPHWDLFSHLQHLDTSVAKKPRKIRTMPIVYDNTTGHFDYPER
ncbi:MAG: hypothetical protein JW829_01235 [Pirellulales bacterium]|nr:hypothetical protein [Pirellulales bacterium]